MPQLHVLCLDSRMPQNSHGLLLTQCPGSSCHLRGEPNSTAGAEGFAFHYERMENSFNGTVVKDLLLYQKCPEWKGWSTEVYLYGMLSVCEFVICSVILNVCKFIFLLGNSSAFPWCFAVVSWEDRHWDHFPVVSGCFWYSSASSFCCPVSSFFLMLSFAVLYSVPLLSCFWNILTGFH